MTIKTPYLAKKCYRLGLTCPFNVDTEYNIIDCYRVVTLSTEAATADGESITDNEVVTYPGGANTVGPALGVVTWEGSNQNAPNGILSVPPSTLRDANVTVALDQTYIVQVAPGEVIPKGSFLQVNATGQAVAAGVLTTGFLVIDGADGAGTLGNEQYVLVLINQATA